MSQPVLPPSGYHRVNPEQTRESSRHWWDENAQDYLNEFGEFLGEVDFCWCPESVREQQVNFLGDISSLRTQRILEIGCGAAQASRWLKSLGVPVVATDISLSMLQAGHDLNRKNNQDFPLLQCDARQLPFTPSTFDQVFTAYGVIPFISELSQLHREVFKSLKPGGFWTFSTVHPLRWVFLDDPSEHGLEAVRSYFDSRPYIESENNQVTYAEYHHTLQEHFSTLIDAGFELTRVVEPEWPADLDHIWGGWSPTRGKLIPGTLIVRAHKPVS